MNTADRSVEALDSALRRRFSFIECPPDPSVLDGTVVEGGVDVVRMLRVINARLELLIDRDHLLGHAYFMAVQQEPTIEKLKEVVASGHKFEENNIEWGMDMGSEHERFLCEQLFKTAAQSWCPSPAGYPKHCCYAEALKEMDGGREVTPHRYLGQVFPDTPVFK